MVETINRVSRASHELVQELGRDPSSDEIAKKLNMPVERVEEIMRAAQEPISLETPVGEEDDSHLGDFIEDEDVARSLMQKVEEFGREHGMESVVGPLGFTDFDPEGI